MHEGEVVTTADDVRRLLTAQLPLWADLPVTPVAEHGTDHCLFRLGDHLVARMPRVAWAAEQARSDAAWLPRLAPLLPVAVPAPLAVGEPDDDYPWAWSVAPWLPGAPPTAYAQTGPAGDLADDLAAFVRALHAADPAGGPLALPGARGAALTNWDDAVREAIEACGDRVDRIAVTAAWDDAVSAPPWPGPPVWIHGDLLAGNLLVVEGHLSAVIDFGALGLGDPAPDLQPAWCVVPERDRSRFRDAVGYDDDTWRRGRGWALGPALTGIPYYWDTVPAFARRGLATIEQVLADLSAR